MSVVDREALAGVIQSVTDNWDEPLDEVHDVPQIVNAILASDWLAQVKATARAEGAVDALEQAADTISACLCDRGPTSDGPEQECPQDGEEAARFYLGYAADVLRDRARSLSAPTEEAL